MPVPAVSIALCTRNGAAFAGVQVESILTQTLPPAELVVSDDASTDDTLAVVRDTHSRVGSGTRLVVLENRSPLGVTANFTQAMTRCTGELVALSDQDDRWHPERLARAVERLADPGVLLVGSDAVLTDADGDPLGRTLFADLEVSAADFAALGSPDAFRHLLRRNLVTGATMTVRRELISAAAPVPAEWVHDEWLALVAAATGRVALLDEPLIDYRQHGGNAIGVARPTLRRKIRRSLEPGAARRAGLARRWGILARRIDELPGASSEDRAAARAKAEFEAGRAALPSRRAARIPGIARLRSGYPRFASQGRRDILRDILSAP